MLIERNKILNNYASRTQDKGSMYYIYSNNSKMEESYNIYMCGEGISHNMIEIEKNDLPNTAQIGSVLRKHENIYILDEESTNEISNQIHNMKEEILKEQTEYLESKKIENHIYELSEYSDDRVWLFDVTSGESESIEEIEFPMELLENSSEGDLFIFKNGEYQKYIRP